MKTIHPENTQEKRLDVVLAEALAYSRSQIQKAVKRGLILVDGHTVPVKFLVNHTHTITYDETFFEKSNVPDTPPIKLSILFENEDVLVVNKPAGVLVHPTETSTESTLVNALLLHNPSLATVGDDPVRPGIVHRLDKGASGVMIVAKTQNAFDHLKMQFKSRQTQKKYTVLVHGKMSKTHDKIDFPIARSKTHGRMAAKPESQGGKPAITYYDVTTQYPHHSLLDVEIMTGRTHQIRAHMFALGHPVVGDTLYRTRGLKPMPIGRLFLHARELTITLPNGETQTFTANLPKELEDVLKSIPKL